MLSLFLQAAKYKGSLLPVLGAVIGGSLGGPVGIIAGLKIGGVAALGGGLMGKFIKKKRKLATVKFPSSCTPCNSNYVI